MAVSKGDVRTDMDVNSKMLLVGRLLPMVKRVPFMIRLQVLAVAAALTAATGLAGLYGPVDYERSAFAIPAGMYQRASWEDEVVVADYGTIGTGLYVVGWTATVDDREICEARGLFEVEGSVFSDPIGIAATASLLLGGVGLALTVGKDTLATLALTINVTFGGKVKKGEEPAWYHWLRPRVGGSLWLTLLSTLTGLLFCIGTAVFIQQAAIAPLSFTIALQILLPSVLLPPALSSVRILDHMIHQQ